MTVMEGVLLMIVIGFMFYYFVSFVDIKKEPINKIVVSWSIIKKVGLIIILILVILTIICIPLTGVVSDIANKSYLGSLIGSFVAVAGAVSAALITVKLNKKHEEHREFPKRYAKLKMLTRESVKYSISISPVIFDKEILDDADIYMLKKLEKFIEFFDQSLAELTYIDNKVSLKFIDLFKREVDLASTVLELYKERGSISMYSNVYSNYEVFQTEEAKELISRGRKISDDDPDDVPFRIIDGFILYLTLLPAIYEKVNSFTMDLNDLDKVMRTNFK